MSFRRIRHGVWRIGLSIIAGLAFGCFGLVAAMMPGFVYEKAAGAAAPGAVLGLLAVSGALTGGLWGLITTWRDVGPEPRPPRPKRSMIDWLKGTVLPKRPPWEVPRYVDWLASDDGIREQLVARLDCITLPGHDPIATRTSYLRDRYTGQLWQEIYCEQGFGSGYAYAPVDANALPR